MLRLNLKIAGLLALWALQSLGSLLIGSSAEAAQGAVIEKEQVQAYQFTASATGTLKEIAFHTSTVESTATSVVAAIYSDSSGTPGSVLAGGEATFASKPATNALSTVTGLSASVTSGTKYWLALLPLGGGLKIKNTKEKGTAAKTSSAPTKVTKASSVTGWGALEERGPFHIEGLGEEALVGGPGSVSAGARVTMLGERRTEGTAAIHAGVELSTTGVAQLQRGEGRVSGGAEATAVGARQTSGVGAASAGARASAKSEAAPMLLIGSQAAIVGTPATLGLEGRPRAFKFTAQQTGLVNQISFFQAASPTAGGIRAAILADNAGVPGALVGTEGTLAGPFTAETTLTVTEGLSAQVIKGREYWLTLLSTGGGKVNLKVTNPVNPHSPSVLGASSATTIGEEASWGADTGNGPMILYGLGHLTPQGSASVSAGGGTTVTSERTPSGTGRVSAAVETGEATGEVTGGAKAKPRVHAGARASGEGARQTSGSASVSAAAQVTPSVALGPVTTWNYRTSLPYKKFTREQATKEGLGVGEPFLDLYAYTGSTPLLAPLVICVHGGGWRQGYPGEYEGTEQTCIELQRGTQLSKANPQRAACANIEYHLAEHTVAGFVGTFAQAIDDVVTACEYAIGRASELRADPSKVFLLGASAGGHLVAAAHKILTERGYNIKGVIMLSGLPDLDLLRQECEQSISAGQSGEPLYNESIQTEGGPRNLTKHFQEALQQNIETGFISGAPSANTSPSIAYQDAYSPSRQAVLGLSKWFVASSEKEVVSMRMSKQWQEHLEAEGKWNPSRCRRLLRTNAHTETHANGLEELATGNEGKGHALAYLSESASGKVTWERLLPFIFAVEGQATVSAGARTTPQSRRTALGVSRVSAGAELSTVSGRQIEGFVSAGVRLTQTGAFQHLVEVRITTGAEVAAVGTRATSGRSTVTSAAQIRTVGTTRFRSKGEVSAAVTIEAVGERVIDKPSGTPFAGEVAVAQAGRMVGG